MTRLRAAVVGLGSIGFRFSLDPLRRGTWSHVAAYRKCGRIELAGAVETCAENESLFKRHGNGSVPVFRSVGEMMEKIRPDIVSICTPTVTHRSILEDVVDYPVRAIFCEKPIAAAPGDAKNMIRLCEKRKVLLSVNHNRRWNGNYLFSRDIIRSGGIGNVTAISAFYSGQIFNIGTHLFDTIAMLVDRNAVMASGISRNPENRDPDISGWIRFDGNIPCAILAAGKREDLIFEIDVIGDEGRIRITENGKRIYRYRYSKSRRYSGYRELEGVTVKTPAGGNDSFVDAVEDIVSVIGGKKTGVNCSGRDGLAALSLSTAMYESAKREGALTKVEG